MNFEPVHASLHYVHFSYLYVQENRPLHSFEDFSDYVYDTKWSPIHPALFATVDGMGRLDIWNLNNDIEVPQSRCLSPCVAQHAEQSIDLGRWMGVAQLCCCWLPGAYRQHVQRKRRRVEQVLVALERTSHSGGR